MFLLRNLLLISSLFIFNTFCVPENLQENTVEKVEDNNSNWKIEGIHVKRFVENNGQFDYRPVSLSSDILYAVDNGMEQIYFTKKGISYYFEKRERNPDRPKGDRTMQKKIRVKDLVNFEWENANPNVQINTEGLTDDYFVYSFSGKKSDNFDFKEIKAQGFKKLIYRNIYPKVDLEYFFHPESGIKYNVILHPGADISQFKMKYASDHNVKLSSEGKVLIPTIFGTITEHQPKTFYADSKSEIPSDFVLNDGTVAFQLSNYDNTKKVIIDPWVQTPSNPTSNCVWEVENDAAGNAYIIGGESPMRLQKYNSSGVLQWTHNTPYNVNPDSMWLGTLATDQAGNSYVTNGSTAAIQRINTSGSVVWNNTSSLFGSDEYWCIAFNSDETKMFVGGTINASGNPLAPDLKAAVFDISTGNGNINGSQIVAYGSMFSFPPNPALQEVRAITAAPNSQYYYLTHDTIGAIYEDFSTTTCTESIKFKMDHSFKLGYKCENYRPSVGNAGIKAIEANNQFVYIQDGATIQKRSLLNGAVLGIANIPGGINITNLGLSQVGNSGIAIDNCGNVYVGSANAVVKYDANLNIITSYSTPYRVYDVAVNNNGEILIAGSTGTNSSSSRVGYVEAANMSACAPLALINCDATICPPDEFCLNDPSATLTPNVAGGTWSGPGITNSSTGEFNPSIAGVGQHAIAYTRPCGSDTAIIIVNECSLEVCAESNGDLTAYGVAPYTWESQVLDCSACPFGNCFPPICNGVMAWQTFSTTQTATPPDYPVRVTDSNGDVIIVNSISEVPLCPDSCAGLSLTLSNVVNPSCFGDNNGSFTITISGFTAPFDYTLQNQNGGTVNNFSSSNTSESFSGLNAQLYLLTVTDADGCSDDITIALTEPNVLSITITDTTDASCTGNDGSATASATGGTPNYSYTWTPSGGNNATASNLAAGSYSVEVEDANGCIANTTVIIESSNGPSLSIDNTIDVSCFGLSDGSINVVISDGTLPYTFEWSNGATSQNITNLPAGNYTLTATDDANCTAVINATISEPQAITISGSISGSGCDGDASITVNATGGTSGYSYEWSTGTTGNTINNLNSGNYTVTVTDAVNCTASESFDIDSTGSFTIDLDALNASCPGVDDGQVTLTVNGANLPLSYSWSNGGQSEDLLNIGVGIYSVTISDANNCTVSAIDTVFADENIRVFAGISQPICPEDETGAIKITPLTGTPPYTGMWSNGDNDISIATLLTGTYNLTLTDSAGCVLDTSFDVNSLSNFKIQTSTTGLSCTNSESTGSASTEVISGNTGPYTYNWSTGEATQNISELAPGMYIVTVTDTLGCEKIDTVNIFVAGLFLSAEIIDESCPEEGDGAIITTVAGGISPYSYNWSNGSTDSSIFNLNAGDYDLTVSDSENCSTSETFEVRLSDDSGVNCDTLIIYDVFSPNGDGRNDTWIIDGLFEYSEIDLQIFNRWGGKVYEANPYNNDWDGRSMKGEALPTATYYYILKVSNGNEEVYSGHVNIIR